MMLLGMVIVSPVSAKVLEARKEIREEYKQKTAKIKDERKKNLLEKFEKQMSELNTRRTAEALKHLDQMAGVLNKMVSKGATTGVDVAKNAVEIAKQAVSEQAAKKYTTVVADETKLREDANKVKSQLEQDLKSLQDKVKTARMAVYEVVRGVSNEKK